jgi:hypothetical protein
MAQTNIAGPIYVVGHELADAKYGPYLNTTQALTLLPIEDRKIGQTVGVYDGTGIVEYWFKDGIEDIDLIVKTSGGGGGDMLKATYDVDNDGVVDSAETVKIIVRNSTGSTLLKGQIVYLSGATGNRPNAVLADSTDEATSSKTIGMVAANIANNADGYVAVSGTLHDLDTSSFTAGNSLWLSETAGAMQANTPPAEPAHAVFIGYVARSHPTQGRIILAIQNGYELTELHGVTITSPATNDFLYYASDGIWKNKQLSASDIPTGIDATKINTGAVSNTEFNYLDGVTSAIQTQLDSKAADSAVVHNTGTETVGGAKTFSSLITASAGVSITAPTGSGASNVGAIISGSNTNGGTSYLDFLKAINTASGATNINKYFRLNSAGAIEIVNSAYSSVIFTLTDTGSLNGATQAEMGYLSGVTSAIQTQLDSKITGYTAPLASIASGGSAAETTITSFNIPAGYLKTGDNILYTVWGARTSGASTGVTSTLNSRVTDINGSLIFGFATGNRHHNYTLTGRVLSDTSIVWWQNSPTSAAVTTTVPSLASSGFTINLSVVRDLNTSTFTLYNAILRKYN